MKKLFSLFAAVLFAGSMFAVESVVYTLTPATGSNNSYAGNCDVEISDITWNVTGNASMIPWRIGGKNITDADRSIYSKTALAPNVTKIEIEHGAASSITVNSMKVVVASDAEFNTVISTLTPTFAASDVVTVTRPNDADWSNAFYKITYYVTVSGNNNKYLEFKGAKFYAEGSIPSISAENINLGTVAIEADAEALVKDIELAVTGANLGAAIEAQGSEHVTVSGTLTAEGGTLNLHVVAAPGEFSEKITLTSGETVKEVTISGKVVKKAAAPGEAATMTAGTNGSAVTVNGMDAIKVGKSGEDGDLTITVPANATKLHFFAAAWKDAAGTIKLSAPAGVTLDLEEVTLVADAGISGNSPFILANPISEGDHLFTIALSGVTAETAIKLASGTAQRFVVFGATYELGEEPASDCDWDNIEFFNAGLAPEDENYNQFKICKEDELPNFVNIQIAPWANNNKGIYVNFPTAEIGAISLPADQYKIDGAGVLLFLSAFTAKVTDASIEFQGVARAFTVYNDKGTDVSAIDNTAAEAKTIKAIRNGQVVIIRDGKVLNMLGVEMD